jgi:hypothetical protein
LEIVMMTQIAESQRKARERLAKHQR